MGLKEERGRERERQTDGQTGGGTDRQGDRETDSLSFESNETHSLMCRARFYVPKMSQKNDENDFH